MGLNIIAELSLWNGVLVLGLGLVLDKKIERQDNNTKHEYWVTVDGVISTRTSLKSFETS